MDHAIWGSCDIPVLLLGEYQYEPLVVGDAVRILNLEPADDFQSPLHGSITQHQLECESIDPDGCKYSAVSYTWGNSKLSHKLFLRLDTKWTLLSITRNADLLLRYLRDAHKETPLWIDGVCLNQSDQGEKAQQVPLMGQIYVHAKRVHIWLGNDEIEDAQRAFSLIRRIELEGSERLRPETDAFLCLERFFDRPWFTRRWIVQEVFFAHDAIFHCGRHTLSLSRVMAVLIKANGQSWGRLPGWGLRMLKSSMGVGQTHRQGLLSLLWHLHESECSDKRDRIAALYTLSDALERPPLHYDIGNWKKMYMNVASYYINNGTDTAHMVLLHLCNFGSTTSSADNEVPSWIPNWSTKRQERIPFQVLESSPGRVYPVLDNPINDSSRWIWMNRWREWSRYRFSSDLKPETKKRTSEQERFWHEEDNSSPMKFEVSNHRLRVNYDFLTFVYGCGTVDQVVCPDLSKDFWEEVVTLVSWREKMPDLVKNRFKRNSVVYQANKRHQMEVDSLSSLLISILAGTDATHSYALLRLREFVRVLCAGLCPGRGHGSSFQSLTDNQAWLLQKIRSAMKNLALLRVQATTGYFWATGPLSLVKGDWLTPIIPHGERVPRSPYARITQFMSLRPIGTGEEGNAWYPSPTSDPEGRLRRLVGFIMAEVDSVHVTAKFVGCGGSCIHSLDHSLSHDTVLWKVFLRVLDAAKRRGLPGPITFDII